MLLLIVELMLSVRFPISAFENGACAYLGQVSFYYCFFFFLRFILIHWCDLLFISLSEVNNSYFVKYLQCECSSSIVFPIHIIHHVRL